MISYVDTSAFLAVLDAGDENHRQAREKWINLIVNEAIIVTSNYVLVETFALIQHRLGMEAVREFQDDIVPILTIEWVHETIHQGGVTGLLAAGRKRLSLVDCVSFALMRQLGIKAVFAFGKHFREQGFQCVP